MFPLILKFKKKKRTRTILKSVLPKLTSSTTIVPQRRIAIG